MTIIGRAPTSGLTDPSAETPHADETPQRALVVYEPRCAGTRTMAIAIARGLALEGVRTAPVEVTAVPALSSISADLVVVGEPPAVFSARHAPARHSSFGTRDGHPPGVRDWLAAAGSCQGPRGPLAAIFETRDRHTPTRSGSASCDGRHLLLQSGYTVVTPVRAFHADDPHGQFPVEELDRGARWGRALARALRDHSGDDSTLRVPRS
jgi:hypothetical protein